MHLYHENKHVAIACFTFFEAEMHSEKTKAKYNYMCINVLALSLSVNLSITIYLPKYVGAVCVLPKVSTNMRNIPNIAIAVFPKLLHDITY